MKGRKIGFLILPLVIAFAGCGNTNVSVASINTELPVETENGIDSKDESFIELDTDLETEVDKETEISNTEEENTENVPDDSNGGDSTVSLDELLRNIAGEYLDEDSYHAFEISEDGYMNWIGGYGVDKDDIVSYGDDYILYKFVSDYDNSVSYYKLYITDDYFYVYWGKTENPENEISKEEADQIKRK